MHVSRIFNKIVIFGLILLISASIPLVSAVPDDYDDGPLHIVDSPPKNTDGSPEVENATLEWKLSLDSGNGTDIEWKVTLIDRTWLGTYQRSAYGTNVNVSVDVPFPGYSDDEYTHTVLFEAVYNDTNTVTDTVELTCSNCDEKSELREAGENLTGQIIWEIISQSIPGYDVPIIVCIMIIVPTIIIKRNFTKKGKAKHNIKKDKHK